MEPRTGVALRQEEIDMITADLINGCFELAAGLLLSLNVRRLFKDKQVRGVCLLPVMLMAAWGYWNLFFYPIVGATFSFLAGIPVAVVNTIWGIQIFYYGRKSVNTIWDGQMVHYK